MCLFVCLCKLSPQIILFLCLEGWFSCVCVCVCVLSLIHRGLVPVVAEYRYLDKVKWLDMYGVDLHPVMVSQSDSLSVVQTCVSVLLCMPVCALCDELCQDSQFAIFQGGTFTPFLML